MNSKKAKSSLLSFSKRRLSNAMGPYAAGLCAGATVVMASLVLKFTGIEWHYDAGAYILRHFLYSVPFSLLFLFNIPMHFAKERRLKKIAVKHLTFVCILMHGITGTIEMLQQLPPEVNAYPAYFWFTYGVLFFFLGAANFLDFILYGAVYFVTVISFMVHSGEFSIDEKLTCTVMLFQLLHFTPVALLARSRIQTIQHAFRQLEKVFYPHQINMIRRGRELEQTMPTLAGEACVICFDIISSSTIQHIDTKTFLRHIFARCNTLMMEGYNGIDMASCGYRIKEMGDGFLCSVGYPFQSATGHLAKDALHLALQFHAVFRDEVRQLNSNQPIHCGIGIAYDGIAGFFPESGAKEYDLHGRAITLATRYEAMRKSLFLQRPPGSLIILQERVWSDLQAKDRQAFVEVELAAQGFVVRDDAEARAIFYRLLES